MKRGEIWHVDLNPTKGTEQQGARYVLIISGNAFQTSTGRAVVAPITIGGQGARSQGWTVSLSGAGTNATGVILCDQIRTVDLRSRGGRFSEVCPDFIVDDVLSRVSPIFE